MGSFNTLFHGGSTNFKWISSLSTSRWFPYTHCNRSILDITQKVCGFQIECQWADPFKIQTPDEKRFFLNLPQGVYGLNVEKPFSIAQFRINYIHQQSNTNSPIRTWTVTACLNQVYSGMRLLHGALITILCFSYVLNVTSLVVFCTFTFIKAYFSTSAL